MPINVNQAIDLQTGTKIYIQRSVGGSYVDGIYVEGPRKLIKAIASQQAPTPSQISLLEGLERTKDIKAFYVNKAIIASDHYDNNEADNIVWNGKVYRAMKLGDWNDYGYNLVLGARIE